MSQKHNKHLITFKYKLKLNYFMVIEKPNTIPENKE